MKIEHIDNYKISLVMIEILTHFSTSMLVLSSHHNYATNPYPEF